MRMARRDKAWAAANGVPVIFCKAGERKHLIAGEYLAAPQPQDRPVRAGDPDPTQHGMASAGSGSVSDGSS
jgi:hypothetical protein